MKLQLASEYKPSKEKEELDNLQHQISVMRFVALWKFHHTNKLMPRHKTCQHHILHLISITQLKKTLARLTATIKRSTIKMILK